MKVQTIAARLGASGCYFISLLRLVHHEFDALGLYLQALQIGAIDEDCYVKAPGTVLSLAAGGVWSVRHESATYIPQSGELEILRFERKTPDKTYAHFVTGDGSGAVAYDPLDHSLTVAQGALVSKRIAKKEIA